MSQRDRVLSLLRDGPQCNTRLVRTHYIGRASARVLELRQAGYEIVTRVCEQHQHSSRQVEYVLLEGQLTLR